MWRDEWLSTMAFQNVMVHSTFHTAISGALKGNLTAIQNTNPSKMQIEAKSAQRHKMTPKRCKVSSKRHKMPTKHQEIPTTWHQVTKKRCKSTKNTHKMNKKWQQSNAKVIIKIQEMIANSHKDKQNTATRKNEKTTETRFSRGCKMRCKTTATATKRNWTWLECD